MYRATANLVPMHGPQNFPTKDFIDVPEPNAQGACLGKPEPANGVADPRQLSTWRRTAGTPQCHLLQSTWNAPGSFLPMLVDMNVQRSQVVARRTLLDASMQTIAPVFSMIARIGQSAFSEMTMRKFSHH